MANHAVFIFHIEYRIVKLHTVNHVSGLNGNRREMDRLIAEGWLCDPNLIAGGFAKRQIGENEVDGECGGGGFEKVELGGIGQFDEILSARRVARVQTVLQLQSRYHWRERTERK